MFVNSHREKGSPLLSWGWGGEGGGGGLNSTAVFNLRNPRHLTRAAEVVLLFH